MESDFWHTRWQENRIGFHQSKYNSRLVSLWPTLPLAAGAEVLVPLCGKSLDMLWLHQQGFKVLGVELSEIAAKAFFDENDLPYQAAMSGNLQLFTGRGAAAGIRIVAGDMFAMSAAHTTDVAAVYDRASLVAMPPSMRQDYVKQLAALTPAGAEGILISMNYDPSKMQGPPFSVPDEEVRQLFDPYFTIAEISHSLGPERLGNLKDRGLDTMEERVYQMTRHT